jgi:hypothetical protein
VSRYGTTGTVKIAARVCLWFGTWRTDTVRVILVTDRTNHQNQHQRIYDIALITTDLTATAAEIIARYPARWAIEVTFFDVKNILGVGEARNRVPKAVQRTVPFGLFCHSILIVWYVLHGHHQDDAAQRRASAPWFTTKAEASTLGHARQAPTSAHRHPIYAHITTRKSWKSSRPGHKQPCNRKSQAKQ